MIPEIDAILMITPDFRATIDPPMILQQRNALVRFRSTIRFQSSRGISSVGMLIRRPPTLFIRTSIGPCWLSASRHIRSASAGCPKSAMIVATVWPRVPSSAAALTSESASRPTRTRSAPASARALAISNPRPRLPPVISARFPSNRNLSNTLMVLSPDSVGFILQTMKCDEGYVCEVCGRDVEQIIDSDLYLRYVLGEVPLERLHLQRERHIRCNPAVAQFIVDAKFEPLICDGPFAKSNLDPAFVRQEEHRVTAAWRRLQELPTLGAPVTEYPLRGASRN